MLYNITNDPEVLSKYKSWVKVVGTVAGDQLELFYIRERGTFKKKYEVKFAFEFVGKRAVLGVDDVETLEEAIEWARKKCEEIFTWDHIQPNK